MIYFHWLFQFFFSTDGLSREGSLSLSKIALCSHVPTVFPCILPFYRICLSPPHHQNPPSKNIYRGLLVEAFLKADSCSLVPYDIFPFFPCSPKPLENVKSVTLKILKCLRTVMATTRGCWKHLSVLYFYPFFC